MLWLNDHRHPSKGFALLVVLSSLAILTLLFAISTRLSLAHVQSQGTEVRLAAQDAVHVTVLRATADVLINERRSGEYTLDIGDDTYRVRVVDVGGLVDLNTASPPLLTAYLSAIGLTSGEIERFRTWRRTSRRLLRVEDIARVSGSESIDRPLLLRTATVASGRSGVSANDMPEDLKSLLAAQWVEDWNSAASGVVFSVLLVTETGIILSGTVQLGAEAEARVIRLR